MLGFAAKFICSDMLLVANTHARPVRRESVFPSFGLCLTTSYRCLCLFLLSLRRETPEFATSNIRLHGSRATGLATLVSDVNMTILLKMNSRDEWLKAQV